MTFITTSLFVDKKSIKHVLEQYATIGIKDIELGAAHHYEEGIIEFVKKYKKKHHARFTIHGYFPPDKYNLIINLASQNPDILKRSIAKVKEMIDTAKEIGAELCTFHAGMRVDPVHTGKPLERDIIYDYEDSYATFFESLLEICPYAEEQGVKIGMEPNELSEHNLVNDRNELLLMCELDEIKRLFEDLETKGIANLGILLDLGHLKVTANNLKFDKEEFIQLVKDRVVEVHIHDNNGIIDEHKMLKQGCWPLKILDRKLFKDPIITLESGPLDLKDIQAQIAILGGYE